jgi:hypothetical protein
MTLIENSTVKYLDNVLVIVNTLRSVPAEEERGRGRGSPIRCRIAGLVQQLEPH